MIEWELNIKLLQIIYSIEPLYNNLIVVGGQKGLCRIIDIDSKIINH